MEKSRLPTPGEPEKRAVRAMFDGIAPRYDLLNHVLSAGTDLRWRKRAVEMLDRRSPGRLLDLCTGTADLLIEALRANPGHSGLGVDLSHGMLVLGAAKLHRRGLAGRGRLAGGDGEHLPLRDASFDGVLVAFGIRNVADPRGALREILRVLRPGGRLVVLEFSMPRGSLGPLYGLYFRHLLPRLAGLLSDGHAYEYLPASVERFPSREAFARLMAETGYLDVCWRALSGGIACLHRGDKAAGGVWSPP